MAVDLLIAKGAQDIIADLGISTNFNQMVQRASSSKQNKFEWSNKAAHTLFEYHNEQSQKHSFIIFQYFIATLI